MPRNARLLKTGERTVYHVISRTALEGSPLGNAEKDYLVSNFKHFSRLYFTKILGYSVLGDHFHLLVKMLPETDFSDEQIKRRFGAYLLKNDELSDDRIPFLRKKYSNLSEFVKEIKMGFSRYYNRRYNRRGTFWGDRFKSTIVKNGEMLLNCLTDIDLYPVKAGLVKKAEDYHWSAIGYHVQMNNKDNFLCLDVGLKEYDEVDYDERIARYRRFLGQKTMMESVKAPPQIEPKPFVKERFEEFRPFYHRSF